MLADLLVPGLNTGDAAGDTYASIERVFGSEFNDNLRGDDLANWVYGAGGDDILYGRDGDDTLMGVEGNDILIGGAGADRFDGGNGFDWAHYGDAPAGVAADLLLPSANSGEATGDSYVSIERLFGSGFNDTLSGDNFGNWIYGAAGDDILYGRDGNDTLMGVEGNDILIGGGGTDILGGGTGSDIFVFSGAAETSQSAADTILDFLSGVDHIDLSLMDANTNIGGDQAFFYSSAGGFTGAAGELIFAYGTLSGDINGDMSADFQVSFANATSLYATDFYL